MHHERSRIKLLHWNAFEVILFLTTNFNCCSIGSNWIAKTSIAKLFVIFKNMNYYSNQHQCFFLEKCVFTHMASIYANLLDQKKELRVQLPKDLFGTPIWPPWLHVKTLYYALTVMWWMAEETSCFLIKLTYEWFLSCLTQFESY